MYLSDLKSSVNVPVRRLVGFQRLSLGPGEVKDVSFEIAAEQMAVITDEGRPVIEAGEFKVSVGGSQGDARSMALGASPVLTAEFVVEP